MVIDINNVSVYGMNGSFIASGYPMRTEIDRNEILVAEVLDMYEVPSIRRAKKLSNVPIGSGHDQFLTGIIVQFNLKAPIKMWTELQRYHFVDFVSSQSTMHRLAKMDLEECFDESVDPRVIEIMKELQTEFNECKDAEKQKELYLKMLMTCPAGLNLTARLTTNYRQLKTIYAQRYNHRLPHWHNFCDWIKTLPYAEDLKIC